MLTNVGVPDPGMCVLDGRPSVPLLFGSVRQDMEEDKKVENIGQDLGGEILVYGSEGIQACRKLLDSLLVYRNNFPFTSNLV